MSAVLVDAPRQRYCAAYANLREREGRGSGGEAELLSLPHFSSGPLASQWSVRARTYGSFRRVVVRRLSGELGRPLRILDLGAGNGWLSFQMAQEGHRALALDIRDDTVDGLRAAGTFSRHLPRMFARLVGSFEEIPLKPRAFDVALFNAALHYAEDLSRALREAARVVTSGGRLAILDSPFYRRASSGEGMAQEKRQATRKSFADLAEDLLSLSSIEFMTRERLDDASRPLGLRWRRHRVLYPLWYEWRPVAALLSRRRPPSRFDLWTAVVP